MEIKSKLLAHFKQFRRCMDGMNIEAFLDLRDFKVLVQHNNETFVYYPQFIDIKDNIKKYRLEFGADVQKFIGWKPYVSQVVNAFSYKHILKGIMKKNDIPTPDYCMDSGVEMSDCIIKSKTSSFGDNIVGPFKSSEDSGIKLTNGDYLEEFKQGKIVKVWLWDGLPVCYEYMDMPKVTGDGVRTIRAIIESRLSNTKSTNSLSEYACVLAYFGVSLDAILDETEEQIVDFKYTSLLMNRNEIINNVVLINQDDLNIQSQLNKIADILKYMITQEKISGLAYTVDGVCDDNGVFWFLEANANPVIHPAMYPVMLSSVLNIDTQGAVKSSVAGVH